MSLLFAVFALLGVEYCAAAHTFVIGTNDFLLDGQRFQIRSGEIHPARVPREYWRHRLRMCKAMGLNTVSLYVFWNEHAPAPGEFVWSGQADDAEFCRMAQAEGLWVILRPAPYACGEWEMGGLPWWLLKYNDIQLRSRDPRFLDAAKAYLKEVGRVFGPLQITRGGPIILAQVENEYGFFGQDPQYMAELRHAMVDAGLEVPLFACNAPDMIKNGLLPDLFQAADFGHYPRIDFAKLRGIQRTGPLFCSEFYSGWFDTWGQRHHSVKTGTNLMDLEYMLVHNASFNLYMAHGGTTFGLWSGTDRPFKPDTSSYDYEAPISEAGWATPEFFQMRALFAKHLLPGEGLPAPPAQNPMITFAPVKLGETAPVLANLPTAVPDETPRNMEAYDQGYGCILYRTRIPAGAAGDLAVAGIGDFGFVFLDGQRVGILDRRSATRRIPLPERAKDSQLDILVEPMGRVDFGAEIADRKGLIAPVEFGGAVLRGWEVFKLPLDDKMLAGLKFTDMKPDSNAPAFWRGAFTLDQPGDTFLDLLGWGKGDLWVNGHCLGRYWNIGPSQTAYTPGCWLHAGENQVVILDLLGPAQAEVAGLAEPIRSDLHLEKDFRKPSLHKSAIEPAAENATNAEKATNNAIDGRQAAQNARQNSQ